jgi:hypothetical protein
MVSRETTRPLSLAVVDNVDASARFSLDPVTAIDFAVYWREDEDEAFAKMSFLDEAELWVTGTILVVVEVGLEAVLFVEAESVDCLAIPMERTIW